MNRLSRAGGLATCLVAGMLGAAEPAPVVLFMGTDLAVQQGEMFLRVQDVSGSAFMVKKGDEPVYVPMQMRSANVRVEKSLKLTTATVTIDKLRGDRTFTPANDPRLKFDRISGAAAGAQAAAELARYQAAEYEKGLAGANANPQGGGDRARELERLLQQARDAEALAEGQGASDFVNMGYHADRMQGELREGNFDAMEVEFHVSAERPVNDAYLIVISRFREKEDKPGTARNWIYAKSVGEIGPKPRYIRIREGGFPRGFILEDYEVHIYEQGRELASNVSPKRVELSPDEARQYLLIEHLAAHKGQTVPAQPVAGHLPLDLREKLAAGVYRQSYHVRVDESGVVQGVFADAAGREAVSDPYLVDLFTGLLFTPALLNGQPTVAMCRVHLPSLRL